MKFIAGKKDFVEDKRDLISSNYLGAVTPPQIFTAPNLSWGMLGNDKYGDCVLAGADHEQMVFANEGGSSVSFTAANALADYGAITGFDPKTGKGDNGTEPRDAMKYRVSTGMIDANGKRHKIDAYMQVDLSQNNEVEKCVYLFDMVGIGIQFPDSAMKQFNAGQPWTVVAGASIEGGHYVPIVGYDETYYYCVTWGQIQKMDKAFYNKYCDEAWVVLSEEMLKGGKTLEGFDLATLKADLAAINTVDPTPTPSPSVDVAGALVLLKQADKLTVAKKMHSLIEQAITKLGG